eukprot:5322604-Pleurochrysis_carterae.AAC.1
MLSTATDLNAEVAARVLKRLFRNKHRRKKRTTSTIRMGDRVSPTCQGACVPGTAVAQSIRCIVKLGMHRQMARGSGQFHECA